MKIKRTEAAYPAFYCRALAIAALAAAAGCGGDSYVDPYSSYYAYGYYYPADLAYADPYYADNMYGYSAYYSSALEPKTLAPAEWAPGAILDLSRSQRLCPEQVTVTPRTADAPCTSAGMPGPIPAGATLEFADCTLPEGARLDGLIDIESSHTFSDTDCDADTVVSVMYTSTSTDLRYTAPSGASVLIPSLSRSGSYTRLLLGTPSALSISTAGTVERYARDGALVAQTSLTGSQSVVVDAEEDRIAYRLDGTLAMEDTVNARTLTVKGTGVERDDDCCHPSSGTITVTSSDESAETWRFGPDCGDLELNGDDVRLSECF